jgi:streptogramin lyase
MISLLTAVLRFRGLVCLALFLASAAFVSAQDLLVANGGTATQSGENVLRYNSATGEFQGAFATDGGLSAPAGLTYGLDGDLYAVTENRILRFNGKTGAFKSVFTADANLDQPYGITIGPNGDFFVANIGTNQVLRYDGYSGAFEGVFASAGGLDVPTYLAFGPDGNLYVSSQNTDQVLRYDGDTGAFKDVFASGGGLDGPFGLAFGPDGDLYVASGGSFFAGEQSPGSVVRYDGTTGAFKSTFAAHPQLLNPDGLAFGPNGDLYVSAFSSDQVFRFRGDNGAFVSIAASGPELHSPSGLGFMPLVSRFQNISTRLRVQTGDNALIGGFIVVGNDAKRVIVRAIGPSLQSNGGAFPGRLADPTLELYVQGSDVPIATNDNWRENQAEVEATGLPPSNDLESAIVRTLAPGAYTAVVRGRNNGTGVGIVEVYDLNDAASSRLANLSTRGVVETGENVMIGGLIVGPNPTGRAEVVVRAIGPSIKSQVPNALSDTTLEIRDKNGVLVEANDNWQEAPRAAELEATGVAPSDPAEAAILIPSLPTGAYTAIVTGKGATGVAVVDTYEIE